MSMIFFFSSMLIFYIIKSDNNFNLDNNNIEIDDNILD